VPRKIFEAQYGTAAISERAFDEVVPAVYSRAIAEHDLAPVDEPQVELVPEEGGQPLRLRATVPVRPHIALGPYKGLRVTYRPTSATDADVDHALETLRSESATLVPVERPVALGDVATLDYEGSIDEVPFEGGTAKNAPTEIALDRFIPGFAEGIVGLGAGETKTLDLTFPAEYPNVELAGKAVRFVVTVHDVKERELPALDDEFARRFGEDATIEGLRADLRKRLDAATLRRAREAQTGELIDRLLKMHEIPLPHVMVERETLAMLDDIKADVLRAGIEWDMYLARAEKTEEQLRAEFHEGAERRVRTTLLIEAIAKIEGVHASREELEVELSALAARYGQTKETIRRALASRIGAIEDGIVRSKTLDFLLDNAEVAAEAHEATIILP